MNSTLVVYDIRQDLKLTNPSPSFRRCGVRINLSCWICPAGCVPVDLIEQLRAAGAVVHCVEFSEQAQDKVLALARDALQKHARQVAQFVRGRSIACKDTLQDIDTLEPDNDDDRRTVYRRWRSVISRARRELISCEQCAMGFGLTRDVQDAVDALRCLLSAELGLALAYREEKIEGKGPALVPAGGVV